MDETLSSRRFTMLTLMVFALVALLLAVVGVYGVMSYNVNQRTQEFGIRLALGANGRAVSYEVVRRGLGLVAVAIGIGGVGAYALSRLMESLLFGVGAGDVATFALASVVLGCVALLACFVPAYRAGNVDPMRALRTE